MVSLIQKREHTVQYISSFLRPRMSIFCTSFIICLSQYKDFTQGYEQKILIYSISLIAGANSPSEIQGQSVRSGEECAY